MLEALTVAEWPVLKHLRLWVGSRSYSCELTVDSVRGLLDSPRLPRLTSLGIANAEFTDELCELLTSHPLLARLEALDLSMGTMTERGAELLLARALRLRHLVSLDVDDNYLPAEAVEALKCALPCVVSRTQRALELTEGELYRYASVCE